MIAKFLIRNVHRTSNLGGGFVFGCWFQVDAGAVAFGDGSHELGAHVASAAFGLDVFTFDRCPAPDTDGSCPADCAVVVLGGALWDRGRW